MNQQYNSQTDFQNFSLLQYITSNNFDHFVLLMYYILGALVVS